MTHALAAAIACLDREEPAVLVTVAEALGSTPREAGTSMVVTADEFCGTIGGGELERRALEAAREMLAGDEEARTMRLPLGPALAQCCGGYVALALRRLRPADRPSLEAALGRVLAALPEVVLYGAGHVGRALVRALAPLPCRISWVDSRPGMLPEQTPENVEPRPTDDPAALAVRLPAGLYHLVMTHSHPLDLAICEALLRRGDFAWAGLIGSASKRTRFERQLHAAGIGADRLARLVCPIGIQGIEGKAPAVIAASVVAQLLLAFEATAMRAARPVPSPARMAVP